MMACAWLAKVLYPQLAEKDTGKVRLGRSIPPGVQLFLREEIWVAPGVAQVQEDLLQGGDAK